MIKDIVKDWKGNEVKEGMTIYFVQTKAINYGRMGMLIPGGCTEYGKPTEVWESDEEYDKRKNEQIWELGDEMIVQKDDDGRLFVKPETKGKGELEGYTFSSLTFLDKPFLFSNEYPTIAIKGISDKKE